MQSLRVACVIPTYNGRRELERLLDSLSAQTATFATLIVDSSSTDGTWEVARARCNDVIQIAGKDFNHGGTRQMMAETHPGYDVFVYLTQDAYLQDPRAVENILQPFEDPLVGAVCGRQLPHLDATVLSQHARWFNYPPVSRIKTLSDIPELGIKVPFMSNSFAAYRRNALRAVGGFPRHVILSEDMYVAAKMLLSHWKVAYQGSAVCRHSHNYTLREEFRRYFDIGVFQARESWIHASFGGARREGWRYVKSELDFLGVRRWYLWPSSLIRNGLKLLAFKLGKQEARLSRPLKRRLGMYKRFWDSEPAQQDHDIA
ncbi:glycosyltransferase family 2 protein [Pseudomonas sp. LP_7_YM]|uniref:glycosyltransferase n=1 Tax=Pseudomonas sp. LP_7_YM TaxID=2485137 RepID=UPI00105D0766|nr:glycosyltransferase [Pseudomonas sp. LP_7_YM]TDV72106.1 rhamnosyltransferase [Pseudomonas sp. LP_7_YM]